MKKLLLILSISVLVNDLFAQYPNASYPFNGNANDATFNANNGVVTGATLTTDRFGISDKAYSFAGGSDVISVPDAPAFNFTDYLSASAWLYISTTPPAANSVQAFSIVSKDEGSGAGMKKWIFGLQNGKLAFHHNGPSLGSGNWVYSNNFTLTQNKWYHVAFVKAAQDVTFYINGDDLGTFSLPSTMVNPAANLQIGNSENTLEFVGRLDEVNIWGNTLTQKEVQKQFYDQALVACFPFNGNADDQSGNDNHGTVAGAILANDRFGNTDAAYDFSVTDKIDVPNSPSFQIGTADYTLAYWIKTIASDAVIMGKEPHTVLGIMQYINGDGTVQGRSEYPAGIFSSDIAINNDVWHQIVFVRKGITSKIFIDGRLSNIAILPLSDISNNDNFSIGHNGPDPFFGQLDDVKIFNVAVDDKTIFDNYIKDQTLPGSGNTLQLNRTESLATDPWVNIGKGYDFGDEPFTYETWLKRDDLHTTLNNYGTGLLVGDSDNSWGVGIANDNTIFFTKIGVNVVFSSGTIEDLKWHHVAVIYTGSQIKFYIDGIDAGSSNYTDTFNGNGNYIIGARQSFGNANGDQTLNGAIDESRIWRNVALTESEIREWMCRKITASHPQYEKLLAYFNFDENPFALPSARKSSVVPNPSVRGFGGHFGELINSPILQTSGAALGDQSVNTYQINIANAKKAGTLLDPIILYHTTGENLTVTSTTGNPDGIQVYHVIEAPNSSTGLNQIDPFPHYFGVFQVGGTSPTYTASYKYFANNVPVPEANLRLFSRTDNAATSWTEYPALPNTSNKTITLTGQNTEYILAGGLTTLPLNLLSFSGKAEENQNILNWQTANEVALSHFEIEKSPNGQKFERIGEVNAKGGPSEKVSYEFIDNQNSSFISHNSSLYYRLRMVDLDGKSKYSKIIALENKLQAKPKIFPNPTSDYFSISGNSIFEKLQIVDATGRLVKELLPQIDNKYSLRGISSGVYFLRNIGGNTLTNSKLIIK